METVFYYPINREDTLSFLGLVTYVGPDPLYDSLHGTAKIMSEEDSKFNGSDVERDAFWNLKVRLAKVPSLAYFNP